MIERAGYCLESNGKVTKLFHKFTLRNACAVVTFMLRYSYKKKETNMKLADVKQTEMDLRHLAEKFEKEYWSIAKQLQNRNFKSRSDQRMAMQTQVEVF